LNPIERLWAVSKRAFGRMLVQESDLSSQAEVQGFVLKCVAEAAETTLCKHVVDCIKRMI